MSWLASRGRLRSPARARWQRRLDSYRSPLVKPLAYRVLLVLVVAGIVMICFVPESALILPALDAVGWDVVTLFVVFELRHYLASLARAVDFRALVSRARLAAYAAWLYRVSLAMTPGVRFHLILWPFILGAVAIETVKVWCIKRL